MLTLRIRFYYVLSACISLCIGYLIYFLGRPGPVIYAIPESLQQWVFTLPLLSHISGSLPGFFHTFAFILPQYLHPHWRLAGYHQGYDKK